MPVTIKIKCFSCGGTFDYYFFQRDWSDHIKCPYCFAEMNHQMQSKMLDAAGEYADAIADLWKDYSGYTDHPLFQFDLISTTPDKFYEEHKKHD